MNARLQDAHRSAFESVLVVQHETPGVLELRGRDRVDLLHRLSTNDLENAAENRVIRTVFTDPVGRTIDVALVLTLPEMLLLLTSSARAPALREWLVRHIFFQDEVAVEEIHGWAHYGAYGPKSIELMESPPPPEGTLESSEAGIIWPVDRPVAGLERLVGPAHSEHNWQVSKNGAPAYEILRVEAGIPKAGSEILDDSIPLEVGLWDAVSFTKGCYIGQEIIARMESRGKLAKQLAGVKLEAEAQPGTELRQATSTVGYLTSVVESPRYGWIAMASVQPPRLTEGDERVEIGSSGQSGVLVELPFLEVETPTPA